MADDSGAPVAYLRTIEDSQRLKESFGEGRSVVVIGGGWIGLEVTAAAREAGSSVTVLESLDLPLLRVLGPEVAEIFAEPPPRARRGPPHRRPGVRDREGRPTAPSLHLGDGEHGRGRPGRGRHRRGAQRRRSPRRPGSTPTTACWSTSACARPTRTSTPSATSPTTSTRCSAAGSASSTGTPRSGRARRWRTRCSATTCTYDRLPYFFTDQYDLGMEYVGSVGPDGYDEVVLRGDTKGRTFTAFWLQGRPGRSRACTSTTGTRPTTSARSSARRSPRTACATRTCRSRSLTGG